MYTFRGKALFILLISGFVSALPLAGQVANPGIYADDANPLGAPGVPKPDSIWKVDKASGAVTIRIAIPTVPANGRGPKIPFLLQYNSASTLTIGIPQPFTYETSQASWQSGASIGWTLPGNGTDSIGLPFGPWSASLGPQVYAVKSFFANGDPQSGQTPEQSQCGTEGPFLFADEDGAVHDLNLSVSWVTYETEYGCPSSAAITTSGATSDGSVISSTIAGFAYDQWSPGSQGGEGVAGTLSNVLYPDGTAYSGNGNEFFLEDSNGNGVQAVADASPAGHWVDSTGRTIVSSPFGFGTNPVYTNYQQPTGQYTVTTSSTSGRPEGYVLSVGSVTPTLAFALPHPAAGEISVVGTDLNNIIPPTPGPVIVLNQLSLPDSTSYQFSYDPVYGTISKITFPQGGYVRFAWTVRPVGRRQEGNVIVQKQSTIVATDVYESDGVNPENHWIYRYADMDPSTYALVTTETAPDGTVTQYTSMPFAMNTVYVDAAPTYLETLRQITSKAGALMETVATAYGSATPNPSPVTETLWDGPAPMQSQTQYFYDKYDNVTEKDESNFYGCSSSSPCTNSPPWLRKTLTSYLWSQKPSYETAHIVDKPVLVTVTDGSGNPVSETKYGYDEFALAPFTGAPNHDDTNYPASLVTDRGNLTSVNQCAAFSGGSCSQWAGATLHHYDSTGLVVEDLDPQGNATNYYYDDQYVAGAAGGVSAYTPSSATHSFVTRVTHASSSFTDQYQYFWYTGELASHTDWNNQTTSYYYDDPFDRGTKIL